MAHTYTEIAEISEGWIDPVDSGILTSLCSARTNPILGKSEYHNGIDIAAEEGSNVYAVRNGTVTAIHYSETYGNVITIETKDGYKITYNHLQKIFPEVNEPVIQGEVIALVGTTGLSTGPHLHYTVYLNDMLMDPLQFTTYKSDA